MTRSSAIALAALVASASSLMAQTITFALKMESTSFVAGETVYAKVDIVNRGTRPVVISDFGPSKGNRLYFEISRTSHFTLPQRREGLIIDDLDLVRDEGASFRIPISEWYDLSAEGRYAIKAVLILDNLRYDSPSTSFDVVPGIELASLRQYVSANPPVERDLRLVYWTRNGQDLAFLRTKDSPAGKTYGTLLLCPILRVKKPTMRLEGDDSVLVFRQVSRDSTILATINSTLEGVELVRQDQAIPGNAKTAP